MDPNRIRHYLADFQENPHEADAALSVAGAVGAALPLSNRRVLEQYADSLDCEPSQALSRDDKRIVDAVLCVLRSAVRTCIERTTAERADCSFSGDAADRQGVDELIDGLFSALGRESTKEVEADPIRPWAIKVGNYLGNASFEVKTDCLGLLRSALAGSIHRPPSHEAAGFVLAVTSELAASACEIVSSLEHSAYPDVILKRPDVRDLLCLLEIAGSEPGKVAARVDYLKDDQETQALCRELSLRHWIENDGSGPKCPTPKIPYRLTSVGRQAVDFARQRVWNSPVTERGGSATVTSAERANAIGPGSLKFGPSGTVRMNAALQDRISPEALEAEFNELREPRGGHSNGHSAPDAR